MKYLYYTNYCGGHSGLSNGIMSVEIGVVLAFLTDRVLVIEGNVSPPANLVDYGNAVTNTHRSRITDLLDLPVPWLDAEDFAIGSRQARDLTGRSLWDSVFRHPPDIDIATADFLSFAHTRKNVLTYTPELAAADVLKVTEGPVGATPADLRNLSFYSYFFYLDGPTWDSVHAMLRTMRPKQHFADFAGMVAGELGPFNAVHARRGDFKETFGVTTLDRSAGEALVVLDRHFDRKERLVILTDEPDDPFFDDIVGAYTDHVFLDRFILENFGDRFLDLPYHDSIALAFLSQLVASESVDFIGSMTSTFTSLIQRFRGNRGKDEPFKFLWNELPEKGDHLERGRHPVSACVPMRDGIMVEERPGPYSWNRYNPRINPAWMREWPESFLHDGVAQGSASERLAQTAEPPAKADNEEAPRSAPDLAIVARTDDTIHVAFASHQVAISSPHTEALSIARTCFQAMLAPAPSQVVGHIRIMSHNGSYHFITDEKGDKETIPPIDLYPHLLRRVVRLFIQAYPDLVWLHAGAAADSDAAVVIAGPWGRGKSTLVTSLYQRGWGYFSDDVIPLDPVARTVHPFPQTPRLRLASPVVLPRNEVGGLSKMTVDIRPESNHRRAVPLSMLVLPHFDPYAETRLDVHLPAMAVAALLESCLSYVKHRETAISTLCGLVQQLPTYRLPFSDAERATDLIVEAHADINGRQASSVQ